LKNGRLFLRIGRDPWCANPKSVKVLKNKSCILSKWKLAVAKFKDRIASALSELRNDDSRNRHREEYNDEAIQKNMECLIYLFSIISLIQAF